MSDRAGTGLLGRPEYNSPVTPHKATNEGSSGPFELHSWLCAEKQRPAGGGFSSQRATHGKSRFVSVDLRVPPLEVLHQRRSEKWHGYDSDVIVSTIAEMDFPLAAPIAAALHAAVDRHDLGYAPERI